MPGQSLRIRKNGTVELRFRFNNRTVSVYGKTQEECQQKKAVKIASLLQAEPQNDKNSIRNVCLRYCERALSTGNVHEEGYRSLQKTARFIGRSVIGNVKVEDLNEELFQLFKESTSAYAETTVKKALYMLKNIQKELF